MGFTPYGNGTSFQTLLFCIDLYCSFIVSVHLVDLGLTEGDWVIFHHTIIFLIFLEK